MTLDVGTDAFLAPEIIRKDDQSDGKYDSRIDIWSAGIFFFML